MKLAAPYRLKDRPVARLREIQNMFAQNPADHIRAHPDKVSLRVQIVESGVFRRVQLVEDQLPDGLGIALPASRFGLLSQRLGHRGQRHPAAVNGGGKVRAKPRHGGKRRALARIGIGTAIGNPPPARAVVVAGVVGAKTLHQPGLARVAILPQPRIPAAARA